MGGSAGNLATSGKGANQGGTPPDAVSSGASAGHAGGTAGATPAGGSADGGLGSADPDCSPGVDCCPANTGSDVFVDPTAGDDDEARGFHPTGIEDPPHCRFRTITHALSRVAADGRVVARSETLPAIFDAETFPLQIPAKVTLTAGSMASQKGDYRILYDGSAAAIIFASGVAGEVAGAAEGLSVINQGGSGALVKCAGSGSVNLNRLVLDGGDSALLVGAQLACPAKVTSCEVRGAKTGISTDGFQNVTSETAYVEVLGCNISNCGLGVDAWGPSVSVHTSVVEQNDRGCIFNSRDGNVYNSKIRDNRGTGVEFRGSRQLQVADGVFSNNNGDGLVVSSGSIVRVLGTKFDTNGFGAPGNAPPLGSGVRFDGGREIEIRSVVAVGNAAHGVNISSNVVTEVSPIISESRLADNGAAGLQFDGVGSGALVSNNEATGNKSGGMVFTAWHQSGLTGNTLHSNGVAQLRLLAPDVTGTIDVSCDSANRFYCYSGGGVGVEVVASSTFDLSHQIWANAVPVVNVDYKGTVTAGSPCAPIACP